MENESVSLLEIGWYLFSAMLFIRWLFQTGWGRRSLAGIPLKKHSLQVIDLVFVFFLYLMLAAAASAISPSEDSQATWHQKNLVLLVTLAGYAVIAAAILFIGKYRFEAGLPGLGITGKQLGKTLCSGFGYFVVGGGLTLLTLFLTVQICQLAGYDKIQMHDILELLEKKPPLASLLILFFLPAIAAPIAEELLFRGLLQNFLIRLFSFSYGTAPIHPLPSQNPSSESMLPPEGSDVPIPRNARWLGILATSLIFAVFHAQWQQWPALFVLSLVLGYSYQRHGNLLIPIFTHAFFNTLPLTVMVLKVYYAGQ